MAKQNLKNLYNQNAHSGNTLFSNSKLFKKGGSLDAASGKLSGLFSNITSPELDYTKTSGLKAYGHNVGGWLTAGKGLYDAYNAFNTIQDIGDAKNTSQDLTSDIISASYNNPTIQYDLAPDQMRLLRELHSGNYDESAGLSDVDLLGVLGDAGMGALTGIGGGIPGIIAGALGGGANSVLTDLSDATSRGNSELEALYQAILESNRQHNAMRRQNAMQYAY